MTRAPTTHVFILVQGLTGTGKSLAVENLACALEGRVVRPITGGTENALPDADRLASAAERCQMYLQANYAQRQAITEAIQQSEVVMEGYVFRTLAHHRAMGLDALPSIDWDRAVPPDLVVLLTCDDDVRRNRLMGRDHRIGKTQWHAQAEQAVSTEMHFYRQFGWPEVDTTRSSPGEITAELVAHVRQARVRTRR